MTGTRTRRTGRGAVGVTAILCSLAAPAAAVVVTGSARSDSTVGTNAADKIFLGAGHDRASGRAGADKIVGGQGRDRLSGGSGRDELFGGPGADRLMAGAGNDRLLSGSGNDTLVGSAGNDVFGGGSGADLMKGMGGRDRLFGGKGRDRILGGGGNDRLNSADGGRDRRVAGGPGRNFCRIDTADLPVLSGCQKIVVGNGGGNGGGGNGGTGNRGGGNGGSGGNGGGPGGGGNGAAGPLTLTSANGLTCDSLLPTCTFQLIGTGADQNGGLVRGEGGASLAAGSSASVKGNEWTATGAYGCSSNGTLVVSIGSETVRAPVTCTR